MNVTTVPVDLARDLEAALDGPVDLVTTSALLDLVSDDWLDRLVTETAARRLPVYAALSYDGRVEIDPADAARRKRSSTRSTRISAATRASARRSDRRRRRRRSSGSKRVGYAVVQGASDWVFGPQDREIQTEVLTGWAVAARETGDLPLRRHHRLADAPARSLAAGRSSIRVGHVDFFAQPTGTR